MTKIRKKTSKRQPVRERYVIQKKCKESRKKMKKQATKMKALGLHPKSKLTILFSYQNLSIISIPPNLFPNRAEEGS